MQIFLPTPIFTLATLAALVPHLAASSICTQGVSLSSDDMTAAINSIDSNAQSIGIQGNGNSSPTFSNCQGTFSAPGVLACCGVGGANNVFVNIQLDTSEAASGQVQFTGGQVQDFARQVVQDCPSSGGQINTDGSLGGATTIVVSPFGCG